MQHLTKQKLNGGLIKATTNSYKVKGISLVLVGDEAIYADGSTAKIISGAGSTITVYNRSAALIGSQIENGDEIVDSTITSHVLLLHHDAMIPGGFMTSIRGNSNNV